MTSLLIAAGIITLAVYIPGLMFFRALGFSKLVSAICAPLYSVAAVSALPIVYYPLGIPCTAASILGPTVVLAAALWTLSMTLFKDRAARLDIHRGRRVTLFNRTIPFEYIALPAFIVTAVVTTWIVFGGVADSVDLFMPYNDNKLHLNLAQGFLDSGMWSSLHAHWFIASAQESSSVIIGPHRFYPSAMHDLIALTCHLTGASIPIAYHAVVLMFLVVTLPTSLFLLMAVLFPRMRHAITAGAFASASFSAFPWPALLLMGPLVPFFICMACSVPVMAIVVLYVEKRAVRRKLASLIATCVVSAVTLALTQTSALFSVYVFLGAYACHLLAKRVGTLSNTSPAARIAVKAASVIALAAVLMGLLYAATMLPFLQGVVNYSATKYHELPDTLFRLVTFGFQAGKPQYLLTAIVAVGIVECIRKRKVWTLAPALYFALAYVGLSTEAEPLHSLNWLSGFWYHTWHRMGMYCCMFLIPATSLGLSLIVRLPLWAARAIRKKPLAANVRGVVSLALFTAMFAATIVSGYEAFDNLQRHAHTALSRDANRAYSLAESSFVDKVVETVPEGALVINDPNDGSVFSYGANHLNTYYRKFSSSNYTEDALLIRKSLSEYASNANVRAAIERTGARYVLLLDQGVAYEDGRWVTGTTESVLAAYSGINGITDETPGFEAMLADGDMRLYRILND